MVIDLDDILATIKNAQPAPIVLKIDGREYEVKDLTVGEAETLDNISKLADDKAIPFLKSLFVGEVPDDLKKLKTSMKAGDFEKYEARQALLKRVSLIGLSIKAALLKRMNDGTTLEAAMKEVQRRFDDTGAAGQE